MDTTEYGTTGFFVLPRSSWRSKRDKLLFYDLVEQANYRDSVECKRGQLITSALKLAKDTGWTEKQIRGSLQYLKEQGLITIETSKDRKVGMKITILNYDRFQTLDFYAKKGELKGNMEGEYEGELAPSGKPVVPTVEGTSNDSKGELEGDMEGELKGNSLTTVLTTDKHKKDSCPKRRRVYDESTDAYKLAKYLRDRILRWKPDAKIPDETPIALAAWADDMRKMVELDKRNRRDVALVIQWATDDSFWQSNILSAGTLRKQYDKLEGQMRRKVVPLHPPRTEQTPTKTPVGQASDHAYAGFERRAANDLAFQEMLFGRGDHT